MKIQSLCFRILFGLSFFFLAVPLYAATKETVKLTLTEYEIQAEKTTLKVGTTYEFVVTNNGKVAHEVMISPASFPGKNELLAQTVPHKEDHDPMTMTEKEKKEANWWFLLSPEEDEIDAISLAASPMVVPGETVSFTYTPTKADAGKKLEFSCYFIGHYGSGMHVPIVVQ